MCQCHSNAEEGEKYHLSTRRNTNYEISRDYSINQGENYQNA
tara:strand:+ start:370 stop:495 length:126 start_codon:yes stop_codon:yes gene_type:complete